MTLSSLGSAGARARYDEFDTLENVLLQADVGLHGNTHIAFADLNNEAVAEELSKWLHRKSLDKFAGE